MKSLIFLAIALFTFYHSVGQTYTDASSQLPDNGAKGPSMDVQTVDIDQDGDLDIVLANEFEANTILFNDGHAVFTKMNNGTMPQPKHDSEDVAIADFNGDGYEDLIFCSEDDINLGRTQVHEFYLGDKSGIFSASPFRFADSESNAVITCHLNNDAFPDVIFGNKGVNKIFINSGDGTFEFDFDALPQIQRTTQDLAIADIDMDGDLDLFAANEDGNILYINDGTGTFADSSETHLPQGINMETRKATFGDIDGDNDPDLFLSNVMFITGKSIQNRLYVNDGHGKFTDVTSTQLPSDTDHTIDAIFEDVDMDGDLDIVVANVFGGRIKIYGNDGQGKFTDLTDAILGTTYIRDALGVIAADFNGDGLRDLYICDRFNPQINKKDLLLLHAPVTGTKDISDSKTPFRVYPNQIFNEFFIETPMENIMQVHFLNMEGKLVDSVNVEVHAEGLYKGTLDKNSLLPGMYILQVPRTKLHTMVMIK